MVITTPYRRCDLTTIPILGTPIYAYQSNIHTIGNFTKKYIFRFTNLGNKMVSNYETSHFIVPEKQRMPSMLYVRQNNFPSKKQQGHEDH